MTITTHREPGAAIATLRGRFDAHSVAIYVERVTDEVDDDLCNVVVDLSGVEFMDSSALAALVTTLKRVMDHGGELVLVGVADAARIILELTRLDLVFTQAETLADARELLAIAG